MSRFCLSLPYQDAVGDGPMKTMERRGVAKLGYAWEAAQVQIYRGEAELAKALYDLTRQV